MTKKIISWGAVLAIVIVACVIKLHLLDIPLERDEGEYAYIAQLLTHGEPLYLNAYSAKLPGIYFVYAAVMKVFGPTIYGIHLGLMLITAISTVLVFLLSRRFIGTYASVSACAIFAILTLGKYTLAFNIEHVVVLLVLLGALVLESALERGRSLFLGGVIFGLAFITKQHALFFVIFGLLYALWYSASVRSAPSRRMIRDLAGFMMGAVLPFLAVCALLYSQGVFSNFRFWVFEYASKYCTLMTLSEGIKLFLYVSNKILGSTPLVWAVFAAGLIIAGLNKIGRNATVFMMLLLACSLLAIIPGLYFRHHYFIFIFPAAAMVAGGAAHFFGRYLTDKGATFGMRTFIQASTLIFLIGLSLFHQRQFLFRMDPAAASRDIYIKSPVVESLEVAKYIKSHSGEKSRVVVLGSEPQIYFYLKKIAPVSYIYMYPLLESTPYAVAMQERFKKQVEAADAEYLICVNISTSWFNWYVNRSLAEPLFAWISAYQKGHYYLVGIADMISPTESVYRWDDDAASYKIRSESNVAVFKRKIS